MIAIYASLLLLGSTAVHGQGLYATTGRISDFIGDVGTYADAGGYSGFPQPAGGQYGSGFPHFAQFPTQSLYPVFQQPFALAPLPPVVTPEQFNNELQNYVKNIQQQYAEAYDQQQKAWEAWRNNLFGDRRQQQGGNGGNGGGNRRGQNGHRSGQNGQNGQNGQGGQNAQNGQNGGQDGQDGHDGQEDFNGQNEQQNSNVASATGTNGSSGSHQSAAIHAANPNDPNIDTAFQQGDETVEAGAGRGKFVGISTAAYSSASTDSNGAQNQHRAAITTINDNGKISTYKVES